MKVDELFEAKWSADVKEKKHPPEGLFKDGTAEKIAAWALKSHGGDKAKAMASLNFYNNRAGKNESAEIKAKVNAAKKIVSAKE